MQQGLVGLGGGLGSLALAHGGLQGHLGVVELLLGHAVQVIKQGLGVTQSGLEGVPVLTHEGVLGDALGQGHGLFQPLGVQDRLGLQQLDIGVIAVVVGVVHGVEVQTVQGQVGGLAGAGGLHDGHHLVQVAVVGGHGVPVHGHVGVTGVLGHHDHGTIHQGGNHVAVHGVGGLVQVHGVGHVHGDHVAVVPGALNGHIGAGSGAVDDHVPVDGHGEAGGGPAGHAELHGEGAGAGHGKGGGLRGEEGVLGHAYALLRPVHGGGHVQVDVQGVVGLGVGGGLILDVVFHTGAVAAGESAVVAVKVTALAGIDGQHVGHAVVHVLGGVVALRGQNLVDDGALIVVHVSGVVGVVLVQLPGELEHVVGGAGLAVLAPALVAQNVGALLIGVLEALAGAHAADGVGVAGSDQLPEVLGYPIVVVVAGGVVHVDGAHDLGDVLVGVAALDGVLASGQAVKEVGVVEHLGGLQIPLVAGELVQTGHGLVHAAVLAGDVHAPHLGPLLGSAGAQAVIHPQTQVLGHFQAGLVAGVDVAVKEASQQLVHGVVGSPDGGVGGVLLQQSELVGRVGAEEALAPSGGVLAPQLLSGAGGGAGGLKLAGHALGQLLELAHLGDHVIQLVFVGLVAGGGVGLSQGGHEVAGGVAAQQARGLLPAGEGLSALGVLTEGGAEVVEHPVGVHDLQVLQGAAHVLAEHGVGAVQRHVIQVEQVGLGLGGHIVLILHGDGGGDLHGGVHHMAGEGLGAGGGVHLAGLSGGPGHLFHTGGGVLIGDLHHGGQGGNDAHGGGHVHGLSLDDVQPLIEGQDGHVEGAGLLGGAIGDGGGEGDGDGLAHGAGHGAVVGQVLLVGALPGDGGVQSATGGENDILHHGGEAAQVDGVGVSAHPLLIGGLGDDGDGKLLGAAHVAGGDGGGEGGGGVGLTGLGTGDYAGVGDDIGIGGLPGDGAASHAGGGQVQVVGEGGGVAQRQGVIVPLHPLVVGDVVHGGHFVLGHGVVIDAEVGHHAVEQVVSKLAIADVVLGGALQNGQVGVGDHRVAHLGAVLVHGHGVGLPVKGDGGELPHPGVQSGALLRAHLVAPAAVGEGGGVAGVSGVVAGVQQIHIAGGVVADVPDAGVAGGLVDIHPAADGHGVQAVEHAGGHLHVVVAGAGLAALEHDGGLGLAEDFHFFGFHAAAAGHDLAALAVAADVVDNGAGLQRLKVVVEDQALVGPGLCLGQLGRQHVGGYHAHQHGGADQPGANPGPGFAFH